MVRICAPVCHQCLEQQQQQQQLLVQFAGNQEFELQDVGVEPAPEQQSISSEVPSLDQTKGRQIAPTRNHDHQQQGAQQKQENQEGPPPQPRVKQEIPVWWGLDQQRLTDYEEETIQIIFRTHNYMASWSVTNRQDQQNPQQPQQQQAAKCYAMHELCSYWAAIGKTGNKALKPFSRLLILFTPIAP